MIDKQKLQNVSNVWLQKFNDELEVLLFDIKQKNNLNDEELAELLDIDSNTLDKIYYGNRMHNPCSLDIKLIIKILIAAKKVVGIEDMETSSISYDIEADEYTDSDILIDFIKSQYVELENFAKEKNITLNTDVLLNIVNKLYEEFLDVKTETEDENSNNENCANDYDDEMIVLQINDERITAKNINELTEKLKKLFNE